MSAWQWIALCFGGPLLLLCAAVVHGVLRITQRTQGTAVKSTATSRALVVVDIQEVYTNRAGYDNLEVERTLGEINTLARAFVADGKSVLYLQQVFSEPTTKLVSRLTFRGLGLEGSADNRLDPRLEQHGPTFVKGIGDGFSAASFEQRLRDDGVGRITLVGLDGAACIQRTAWGALARGYAVQLHDPGILTTMPKQWAKHRAELVAAGATLRDNADRVVESA